MLRTMLIALVLMSSSVQAQDKKPARTGFTLSVETTYFTSPTTKDGYVDYLAAMNARLKEKVTPEKNAMVAIMQAIGPQSEGTRMHPTFYQHLGVAELSLQGDYFVPLSKHIEQTPELKNDQEHQEQNRTEFWHERITQKPWTAREFPGLAKWITVNDKPLSQLAAVASLPEYYHPLVTTAFGKDVDPDQPGQLMTFYMTPIQACRSLANVLCARAFLHMGEKRFEAAWTDLKLCMLLGRRIAQGSTIIELLVGIASYDRAAEGVLQLARQPEVPPTLLVKMAMELEAAPSLPGTAGKLRLGERVMLLDSLMLVHRFGPEYLERLQGGGSSQGPLKKNTLLHQADWDPTLKKVNTHFERMAAITEVVDLAERRNQLLDLDRELKVHYVKTREQSDSVKRFLYTPQKRVDIMGDMLIVLMSPALLKVQDAHERHLQRVTSMKIALALEQYRRNKSEYPAKLEEVTPTYLKSLPQDQFSGKPLHYEKTAQGYRFYSVGPNGKDDQGRGRQDTPWGDDICVTVP